MSKKENLKNLKNIVKSSPHNGIQGVPRDEDEAGGLGAANQPYQRHYRSFELRVYAARRRTQTSTCHRRRRRQTGEYCETSRLPRDGLERHATAASFVVEKKVQGGDGKNNHV